MAANKMKQNIMKCHLCNFSRMVACLSFLVLTIIGVSSLVRAMSLEKIENDDGVPAAWKTASLGRPDTITVPVTYWDQRQDSCSDPNQQFEWVICGYWTKGAVQGLVKDTLGSDGTPVPTFVSSEDSWNANRDVFTRNITGHDSLQLTDNFYRWFHETDVSKRIDGKTVTFYRTGENTYEYGGERIFPVDDVDFSDGDSAAYENKIGEEHNYHFTGHLSVPVKISANGIERFAFSGDDDVWVFLNGKLILDIGGLHEKLNGSFVINKDGTVSTYVQNVNDTSTREYLGEPSNDFNGYVDPLNQHNLKTFRSLYRGNPVTTNPRFQSERYEIVGEPIDVGLKPGDVVNLDFFYAERSTDDANTHITISNMIWPISADSNLEAEIVGQTDKGTNLVEYIASVKNRDPVNPLNLERLAAYINENDQKANGNVDNYNGFIPLALETLQYTKTPDDPDSWQNVGVSAPQNSAAGFVLDNPILMAQSGEAGDTLYFKYYAETTGDTGNIESKVSFYTSLGGASGVTYDDAIVSYKPVEKVTHNLKIKYQWEDDGSEVAPDHSDVLPEGGIYSVESPMLEDGEIVDEEQVIVGGTMGDEDITIIVKYRRKPVEEKKYRLIVRYKDIDTDEEVASPQSKVLKAEEDYSVGSPDVSGYNLVDEGQRVVADKMPAESDMPENGMVEVVVYYKKVTIPDEPTREPKRKVKIHYVYEDGSKAHEDFEEEYDEGDEFCVKSADIDGYMPDKGRVCDTVPDHDVEYTVVYKKKPEDVSPTVPEKPKYILTIHYVYEDGSEAKPDYNSELNEGDGFDVKSPEIETYTPDLEHVKGVMEKDDLTYTVVYKKVGKIEPELPVVSNGLGSDVMGDLAMFGYLAPLGEVAYVPNTGVVSHATASVFRQYFADIILGQGFILLILLIFAISFAIYFSLRKYRDLDTARKIEKDVAKYTKMDKVKDKGAAARRSATKSSTKKAQKVVTVKETPAKSAKTAKVAKTKAVKGSSKTAATKAKTTTKKTASKSKK